MGWKYCAEHIGDLFAKGHGVPSDQTKAAEWYKNARVGKDAGLETNAAVKLLAINGPNSGTYHEAMSWLAQLAVDTATTSTVAVALQSHFSNTSHEPDSRVHELMWREIDIAASRAQGNRDEFSKSMLKLSRKWRDSLAEDLSEAERKQARQMARDWLQIKGFRWKIDGSGGNSGGSKPSRSDHGSGDDTVTP